MEKEGYFKQLAQKEAEIELIDSTYIQPIRDKIAQLKQQMVDACPFKVGDKVLVKERSRYASIAEVETAYFITRISPSPRHNSLWSCDGYEIQFAKVKKDGTQSQNKASIYPRSLSEIRKVE